MDLFSVMAGPWSWWILAGLLLLLELAAPGVFFVWLALAALAVGTSNLVIDLAWQFDIVLFAALSVVFVLLMQPWYRERNAIESDRPNLNRRMYDYVGRSYPLEAPIANGRGKLRIEDTIWDVVGPDLPAGGLVKVTGVEGLRLKVEPAARG